MKAGRDQGLPARSAELDTARKRFVSGLKTRIEPGRELTLEQKQAAMAAMMSQ